MRLIVLEVLAEDALNEHGVRWNSLLRTIDSRDEIESRYRLLPPALEQEPFGTFGDESSDDEPPQNSSQQEVANDEGLCIFTEVQEVDARNNCYAVVEGIDRRARRTFLVLHHELEEPGVAETVLRHGKADDSVADSLAPEACLVDDKGLANQVESAEDVVSLATAYLVHDGEGKDAADSKRDEMNDEKQIHLARGHAHQVALLLPIHHVVIVSGVHSVFDVGAIASRPADLIGGAGVIGCGRVRATFVLLHQHKVGKHVA